MADSEIVTLRLHNTLIDRADRIRKHLKDDESMVIVNSISRSHALRLALVKGLEAMEKHYGVEAPDEPKRK